MNAGAPKVVLLADFPWSFFDAGATGRGGGQHMTWLPALAQAFAAGTPGREIHWVVLDREYRGEAKGEVRHWGGQVFHRLAGVKFSVDLLAGYRFARRALREKLREIGPDLLHCWGTERAYGVVAGEGGVPTVFSVQGITGHLHAEGLLPRTWQWRCIRSWEERFLRAATVVTCESRWGMARLDERYPGLDLRRVEYGVHPEFFETAWQPSESTPFALFAGTVSEAKGVDLLLDAMTRAGTPPWTLKIAGEGPLAGRVADLAHPRIELLGNLPWDALRREMSQARCLVLPTRGDTSPNVVKEARVIGLPVVTSLCGGQSDYIVDGVNGLLVDPLAAGPLELALSRMMEEPGLAERLGAGRHAEDRAAFLSSGSAAAFLQIYDELLGRRKTV